MSVLTEDLRAIAFSPMIDWEKLDGKTVLLTGSTGLIGRLTAQALLLRRRELQTGLRLLLPVRNPQKAEELFHGEEGIKILPCALEELSLLDERADFVIHAAAPTQSAFFVEHPVETAAAILDGTRTALDYAKKQGCTAMVNLSSMEVFGQGEKPLLKEDELGALSLESLRSSYPMAKRMTEYLCLAYAKEYGVPVKTARLAQTFGPGVDPADGRVFMQFCRAVREGSDIVLRTTGETVVNYAYTTDAVLAILKILLCGKPGEAYTVVNSDEAVTIRQTAERLMAAHGSGRVRLELTGGGKYAAQNRSKLSNEKLRALGWEPRYSVFDGYERLLRSMGEVK